VNLADHPKRFERWRTKLPKNTAYLVEQVLRRIVPEFEAKGFVWYPDFAGGDTTQIGANDIPLQRRSDKEWPTVQIMFDKRFRPSFGVDFAALPPICKRWTKDGYIEIPREKAIAVEGPACFALCQGRKRNYDCQYGYRWFSLFPREHLDSEIEHLRTLLPELFDLFDQGMPNDWFHRKPGRVTKHVFLVHSRRDAFPKERTSK